MIAPVTQPIYSGTIGKSGLIFFVKDIKAGVLYLCGIHVRSFTGVAALLVKKTSWFRRELECW